MPAGPAPQVLLREVRAEDLPVFYEHQRDPESVRLAGLPARARDAFGAHWERILADPRITVRAIVADGVLAGQALRFEQGGRHVVGYWLGREHWGRGIASA